MAAENAGGLISLSVACELPQPVTAVILGRTTPSPSVYGLPHAPPGLQWDAALSLTVATNLKKPHRAAFYPLCVLIPYCPLGFWITSQGTTCFPVNPCFPVFFQGNLKEDPAPPCCMLQLALLFLGGWGHHEASIVVSRCCSGGEVFLRSLGPDPEKLTLWA